MARDESAPLDFEREMQTEEPRELELLASIAEPERRAQLLHQAGDLYLRGEGDIDGALRCYRELLELQPRRTASSESWLLTALRQDRL